MDIDTLKTVLKYNRRTGVFTWKKKTSRKTVIGKAAGGLDMAGYIVIGYGGKNYYAHRLAWLYVYGYIPKQLDHKDGNRSNNAISNLRECSHTQNVFNSKISKSNTSGYKGVSWHEKAGKWESYVCHNNSKKYLGLFDCPETAAQAYLTAVKNLEPRFVRGK
jgi:hypothetical protein